MGFLVTLAAGGYVRAFESIEDLCSQLPKIFNINEEDLLFLSSDCYSITGDNIVAFEEIMGKQLTFLHAKEETITTSLVKNGPLIGITICDGGFGWAIVREVRQNSDAYKVGIRIGDAIERVNGERLRGIGHFKTAQKLRSVPINGALAITLLRPKCVGFNNIGPRQKRGREARLETYRKREEPTPQELVNSVFEEYFGVHDNILADLIIKHGKNCRSPEDLKVILEESPDISSLEFTDDNYNKLWAAVSKR